MAKFQFLGKLKGDDEEEKEEEGIDQKVKELSDQGYSQHEITEQLRDKGYAYSEINQAMNKVIRDSARSEEPRTEGAPQPSPGTEAGSSGETQGVPPSQGMGERGFQEEGMEHGLGPEPQEEYREEGFREEEPGGYDEELPPEQPARQPAPQEEYAEDEWSPTIGIGSDEEALIETIIEEKLVDIEDEFQNIYEEIDEIVERLDDIDQRVHDLETMRGEDEKEFIQRVNEIEEYMENSQSRIGGLEKAFQQTLPSLVENVRDLTDLVKDMKD